jgi:hypothetical protein
MVISVEHARAGLDYYFGFFNILGNEISGQYNSLYDKSKNEIIKLFSKKTCVEYFINLVQNIYVKLEIDLKLSLADYLNCLVYLFACEHILEGGLPGDIHISKLSKKYLNADLSYLLNDIIIKYRKTSSKKSQEDNILEFNNYICNKLLELNDKCKKLKEDESDVIIIINQLRKILC